MRRPRTWWRITSRQPAANPENLSEADGACTRAKVNALLAPRLGKVVGYKAGLTNPAVQKRFNTDKPVWGKLYEGMVLESGATVEAALAPARCTRPTCWCASRARTSTRPRPHGGAAGDRPGDSVHRAARSGGAGAAQTQRRRDQRHQRGCATGRGRCTLAVPVLHAPSAMPCWTRCAMQVSLQDASGAQLGGGKGSDILEHPLNAVVWLAGALARKGWPQPGDLISLGSFSPLLPPKAGLSVTATYNGLPALRLCV